MKLSVVVCSRTGIPDRLIQSLKQQLVQPDEIISIMGHSLTSQRNEGIRKATGDLVMFLDDDVELDPDYTAEILGTFYTHKDAMAVTGRVCVKAFKSNILHTLFAHVFILSRGGKGKFLISGFPETYDKHITDTIQSEVLHGCNMTIKKEVFDDIQFNEEIVGGMFGEDDWFSYQMSRKYPIYYTPFALCYDNREYSRGTQEKRTRCNIINLIARWKERKCNVLESCAFWWSMLGFIILKVTEGFIMRDLSILKGVRNACLFEVFKR